MSFVTSSFCCRFRAISPTWEKLETLTLTPGYTEPALPILKLHLWGKFFCLTPRRLTFSDLVEQCKFLNPRCILTSAASRQPQNLRFALRTLCRIIQFWWVIFSFKLIFSHQKIDILIWLMSARIAQNMKCSVSLTSCMEWMTMLWTLNIMNDLAKAWYSRN